MKRKIVPFEMYHRGLIFMLMLMLDGILSLMPHRACAITEHVYFRNLSVDAGLTHNWVRAIAQDRDGFVWIGTANGLSRYDGKTFRNFYKEDDGPGNNLITALFVGSDGTLWTGTDKGLYRYLPDLERFAPVDSRSRQGTVISANVTAIAEDSRGCLWIAVSGQGLFCYDWAHNELNNYLIRNNGTSIYRTINALHIDADNRVWVGCYRDNFRRLSANRKTLDPFIASDGTSPLSHCIINRILEGNDRHFYLATAGSGVWRINTALGQAERLPVADGANLFVRDLCFKDEELWVATESGLYIYNMRSRRTTHFVSDATDRFAINDNAIYVIMRDSKDGMWLGSYFGGVDFMPAYMRFFRKYSPNVGSFGGKRVRELCDDGHGTIYVGTEDKGLYCYDVASEQITPVSLPDGISNIHGLLCDGESLWVGTFAHGLIRINRKQGTMQRYNSHSGCGFASDDVFSLCKTASGELWAGTTWGLYRYDPLHDRFVVEPQLAATFVYQVLADRVGNLWVATYSRGLYRRDGLTGRWSIYHHDEADPTSLASDRVIGLYEDSHSRLWTMTFGGGIDRIRLDGKGVFEHVSSPLFDNNILYNVVEDAQGLFWITSNKGLYAYNEKTQSARRFTTENGLSTNQFNYRSALLSGGDLYLGSLDGFIRFNPANIANDRSATDRVFFSELFIHSREARVGAPESPLKRSLLQTRSIVFSPTQNSFAFRVSTPDDEAVIRTPYEYRLDGQDADWQSLPASNLIVYSNINPGSYRLQLRQASPANNTAPLLTMAIRVRPPLFKSPVAYGCYALLLIGLLYYLYNRKQRKAARRHAYALQTLEEAKQRDLYEAKIKYFTNIAHEIRTPLTLITTPVDAVLESKSLPEELREDMLVVRKNTRRLLTLTNQLLDFRKIEHRSYTLNRRPNTMSRLVRDVVGRYALMARERQVAVTVSIAPEAEMRSMLDAEEVTKVVSNLLSNAMKFAATQISVSLTATDGWLELQVSNDGPLVPPDKREAIFLPFEQMRYEGDAKRGTGLGLPLSRSLARLMGATSRCCPTMCSTASASRSPLIRSLLTMTPWKQPTRRPSQSMCRPMYRRLTPLSR